VGSKEKRTEAEMTRITVELGLPSKWWDEINESVQWQDGFFYSLSAAFALVSTVALVIITISLYLYWIGCE